jgi:hypothetical protein
MSSKADNVQTAILLFSKYDTDGNGSISKEELKAMLLRKCEDEGIAVDMSLVEKQVNVAKFITNPILLWDMHFS